MQSISDIEMFLATLVYDLRTETALFYTFAKTCFSDVENEFTLNLKQAVSSLEQTRNKIYDLMFNTRFLLWAESFQAHLVSRRQEIDFMTREDHKKFFDEHNTRKDLWCHPQMMELVAYLEAGEKK